MLPSRLGAATASSTLPSRLFSCDQSLGFGCSGCKGFEKPFTGTADRTVEPPFPRHPRMTVGMTKSHAQRSLVADRRAHVRSLQRIGVRIVHARSVGVELIAEHVVVESPARTRQRSVPAGRFEISRHPPRSAVPARAYCPPASTPAPRWSSHPIHTACSARPRTNSMRSPCASDSVPKSNVPPGSFTVTPSTITLL